MTIFETIQSENFHNIYVDLCVTTNEKGSPVKGAPCHFPFVYKNFTYNDCTKEGHDAYWCSTKVNDTTGIHIAGNWGICDSSCPTTGNYSFLTLISINV